MSSARTVWLLLTNNCSILPCAGGWITTTELAYRDRCWPTTMALADHISPWRTYTMSTRHGLCNQWSQHQQTSLVVKISTGSNCHGLFWLKTMVLDYHAGSWRIWPVLACPGFYQSSTTTLVYHTGAWRRQSLILYWNCTCAKLYWFFCVTSLSFDSFLLNFCWGRLSPDQVSWLRKERRNCENHCTWALVSLDKV